MVSYAIVLTAILFIIAVSMMRTASAVSAEGLCRNTKIDLIYHKTKHGVFHLGGFILLSGAITALLSACSDSLTAALSAACYFVAVFKSACGKVLSEIEAFYSCPNFSESNLYLKLKQLRN